eukprot:UN1560
MAGPSGSSALRPNVQVQSDVLRHQAPPSTCSLMMTRMVRPIGICSARESGTFSCAAAGCCSSPSSPHARSCACLIASASACSSRCSGQQLPIAAAAWLHTAMPCPAASLAYQAETLDTHHTADTWRHKRHMVPLAV